MRRGLVHVGRKLFRGLASVKLAVGVLSALAIVLAAATVLETQENAVAARHYVYGTAWFAALLGLLGANVLCAALSRWPWRRHHAGFLVTHLGILILLYGAALTLFGGYEGRLALSEGEQSERMNLSQDKIFLSDPNAKQPDEFPVDLRFNPPKPGHPIAWRTERGLNLSIVEYLPNAEAKLQVEEAGGVLNPALEIAIDGSRASEREWLFSRQDGRQRIKMGPAFVSLVELNSARDLPRLVEHPTAFRGRMTGMDGVPLPDLPDDTGKSEHELVLARLPDGSVQYAMGDEGKWRFGIAASDPIETGWMDFRFRVSQNLSHASVRKVYRRLPLKPGGEEGNSAIHVSVAGPEGTHDQWLARGEEKAIFLGRSRLRVGYGADTRPLGFAIQLESFHVGTYLGTDAPASYESRVSFPGSGGRVETIGMNRPLRHGGFKIFQSSYAKPASGPAISVLSVAYDPGISVKYAGALVMVFGVILMFFFRPLFARGARPADLRPAVLSRAAKAAALLLMLLPAARALASAPAWPAPHPGMNFSALRAIPILEGGRVKPIDSFAREMARTATGRERFGGFDPVELMVSWMTELEAWERLPILEVGYQPLIAQVGLRAVSGKVAPFELRSNEAFLLLAQSAATLQREGGKLGDMERAAANLMLRLDLFYKVNSGELLAAVPGFDGAWRSFARLPNGDPVAGLVREWLADYHAGNSAGFLAATKSLRDQLALQGKSVPEFPDPQAIGRELFYNSVRPFLWAWLAYALAFFILLMSFWVRGKWAYRAGLATMAIAIGWQLVGFYLRCRIAGRAPVTNMYETVIWVSLGIAVFAMIFECIYRPKYYALAGSALATLGLILAGSSPAILDPKIVPLVPVLRDNFWLTVHVLTITLSYAAFALALGVGNVALGYYIFRPSASNRIVRLNYFLYRALQVGVVLLAAGTILGGVWANASWGRFWGWDPKEVWALIALLGYLIILHGRYAGWLRGFGLTVGSVLAFLLILMSWYGVNFILGVGLHSYGFSSGGAGFVTVFTFSELLWIGIAVFRFKIADIADLEPSKSSKIAHAVPTPERSL